MNVLVTSTRQPFALDEVRKFGRMGHRVIAMDPLSTAPGSHSRFVARHVTCPAPRFETAAFLDLLEQVLVEEHVDLLVPTFEDAFYIARHHERFSALTEVFCPPFETLARLHHKASFAEVARECGVATPLTTTVTSQASLGEAISGLDEYLARPVFSRGGTRMLTNVGPLSGVVTLPDCHPTEENPWLVQSYVHGTDLCTFGVARHGRVTAHLTYVHPIELEHGSGIVFESIDDPTTLAPCQRMVETLGYHGQVSFDFRRTPAGELVALECNPRPTAGVLMMPTEMFVEAVLGEVPDTPFIAPAGARNKISMALLREMLHDPQRIPEGLRHLFSRETHDVFAARDDLLPALYQFFTWPQIAAFKRHAGKELDKRTMLIEAFSYDTSWNGEPIP